MSGLADFLNEPAMGEDVSASNGFSLASVVDDTPAAPAAETKRVVQQLGPNAQAQAQRMKKLWSEGKVQAPVYLQIYTALLHGVQTPAEVRLASDLTDLAYLQFLAKQG